jgi:hypothetical protein
MLSVKVILLLKGRGLIIEVERLHFILLKSKAFVTEPFEKFLLKIKGGELRTRLFSFRSSSMQKP